MKKKNLQLAISFILVACLITGCAFFGFDASAYVKACLDSNIHGEFDEYAKITNSSVEDVEKLYNDFLDNDLSFLNEYNVDDARRQEFRELFIKLYKNFKYDVGEATKTDDTYTVPVTYQKLIVFDEMAANMEKDTTDYFQAKVDAGENPSTDEIYEYVLNYMYDGVAKKLENPQYEEPVTVNVTVSKMTANAYGIDTNELQELVQSMVDMDAVE